MNPYKDGVTRTLELLQQTFGTYFKAYFEGNPDTLKQGLLPCVAIYTTDSEYDIGNSAEDENTHDIMVRLILNKKEDDFSQIQNPTVKFTDKRLRNLIGARDPATGFYLPNTLAAALRTNWTQGARVIGNKFKVEMVVVARPDGVFTSEALITLTLTERVQVLNRA